MRIEAMKINNPLHFCNNTYYEGQHATKTKVKKEKIQTSTQPKKGRKYSGFAKCAHLENK
jgi:hypothetical protein